MILTIDASVSVSVTRTQEIHHAESRQFFDEVVRGAHPVISPAIVLPETVAAIARADGSFVLTQQARQVMMSLPSLWLVPVDVPLAEAAAQLAELHRLRGADAIYLAVAVREGTTLITWDNEMRQRGANAATVLTPAEWLAQQTVSP